MCFQGFLPYFYLISTLFLPYFYLISKGDGSASGQDLGGLGRFLGRDLGGLLAQPRLLAAAGLGQDQASPFGGWGQRKKSWGGWENSGENLAKIWRKSVKGDGWGV